jgi:hypothetical protein
MPVLRRAVKLFSLSLLFRFIMVLAVATSILPMVGCDDIAKEFGYAPVKAAAPPIAKAEPAPIQQELTGAEISMYLDGEQWTLEPSKAFKIDGDLRPIWIVTGRIKNNFRDDIKSVRVRLVAYDKSEANDTVLDTADFDVEDIPALEARAFRRDVQLMIYQGKFRWNYEFLSATVKRAN